MINLGSTWHHRTTVRTRLVVALVVALGAVLASCGTSAETTGEAPQSTPTQPAPAESSALSETSSPATSSPATTSATTASTTATTMPPTTASTMPPTTVGPVTLPPVAGGVRALDVLALIPVAREQGAGYDRALFDHWITQPGGCSTRETVLIRDSLTPAQVDPFGCKVVEGDWLSSYDGVTWQFPADVDIDHVVALKEAWDSGAWAWNDEQRRRFANDLTDPRTLRAVTDSVNQSKADKDPSNWMPPVESEWCRYLGDWLAIKARWQLTMDESEAGRIRNVVTRQCPDLTVAPWTQVSVSAAPAAPPAPIVTAAPVTAPPVITAAPAPAPAPVIDVYYANCTAARAAGAAPVYVGDPGYRRGLDRDGDGVACE